jgi:hypothetical protein
VWVAVESLATNDTEPLVMLRSAWKARLEARAAGLIALGAAMLMAVTLAIGRPTVFTDTDDYFAQGADTWKAAAQWVFHGKPPINPAEVNDRLHDPGDEDEEPVHNENGARSVYYGLFVAACERIGTLWLLAAAQATLAAAVVYALWRTLAPGAQPRSYLATMAVLAVGSSLPVFTGFAMPDVFAGFSVAAVLLIALHADRFGRWGKAALWGLLAACMNFHGSNLLSGIVLAALALGWLASRGVAWRKLAARGGAVLAAAVVAVLAGKAYAVAIKLRTGDDLGRPPFLTARVLADGPGRAYLRHACSHGAKYVLCRYAHDPLDDSEDILWSDDPAKGIFNSGDYHSRLALQREEKGFVLHAVASDPLGELSAALKNWGKQLISVSYAEPMRDPAYYLSDEYWKTTTLKPLLLQARRCDPEVGGCILNLPATFMSELDAALALAALGWLGWMLWADRKATADPHPPYAERGAVAAKPTEGPRERAETPARASYAHPRGPLPAFGRAPPSAMGEMSARPTVVFLILAVIVNAAVCGMLSGPFDRYQARLLWLVPASALLYAIARRRRRAPI